MKGVDIRTTQEPLGHADIRMTLRYPHLSPSCLLDAVEKLLDATGTTTGTSESEAEERQMPGPGTARTHRGTREGLGKLCTGRRAEATEWLNHESGLVDAGVALVVAAGEAHAAAPV
jgi:hypothetical protein